MFKPAVYMLLLFGLVVSAAAIGKGGSLNGILSGVTTDGLHSSDVDHGLVVLTKAP